MDGLRPGRLVWQVVEQAAHQFIHGGQRRLGFGRLFGECGAVGGLLQIRQILAQRGVGVAQYDLAKRVQFGAAAAREAEVRLVKEVELPPKG